jgi:hypothetical protein
MKRLLVLGPQEIQSGIYQIGKAAAVLWQDGRNIVFRDLGFRSAGGATQKSVPLGDQARDIAQAYVSGTLAKRLYFGTDTKVEMHELIGGVWTETDLLTWPTAGQYADLETWGTWLVATNGVDPVKVWKNTGLLVDLAGTPFTRAKIIKRKQPFLLAFNTNNIGDTGVEWSSDSDIENWTPTSANSAGNVVLRDLESAIVAVTDLGPRLAIYSLNTMVIGTFIGAPNVWSWQRAISGIGAISSRSVVTLDPFNYGLTRDGIFKTDGVSSAYVDDPAMLKYIRDTADFSRQNLFWGFADALLKCVTFNFLDINNTWRQVSYYPDQKIFTKGDMQLTAGSPKQVLDYPIVAGENLRFGTWQEGAQIFGADVSWSIKTKPLDFGERSLYKLLQLIRVDGSPAGSIRVCALDDPEGVETVVIDQPIVKENYFEFDAPYFTVEFYGTEPPYITGIEFFGEPGGTAL